VNLPSLKRIEPGVAPPGVEGLKSGRLDARGVPSSEGGNASGELIVAVVVDRFKSTRARLDACCLVSTIR
jgi:hypothetical protein